MVFKLLKCSLGSGPPLSDWTDRLVEGSIPSGACIEWRLKTGKFTGCWCEIGGDWTWIKVGNKGRDCRSWQAREKVVCRFWGPIPMLRCYNLPSTKNRVALDIIYISALSRKERKL